MADALVGQGTYRPASLRSVASSSSVSSGVSLTRRARIKGRPKTAGSSGRAGNLPGSPKSELPYIDISLARGESRTPPSQSPNFPPRSHRNENEAIKVQNDERSSQAEGRVVVADTISEGSQSPPMTPRVVRIRTSARILWAYLAVVEASKTDFWFARSTDCCSA
jgi:hypothetical protein